MFHSILVPLDGSTLAEQALPLAAAVAEQNEASLSLAVVHPWGPAEDAPRPGTHADHELREGVARHLAHHARASVLFIKPQAGPLPIILGGFRRVLVALDGSPGSEAALLPAAALSSNQPPVLTLVAVISGKGETLAQRRAQAESYFEGLLPQLQHRGCRVETVILFANNPATAIVRYAKEERIELIALTTRPRGSAARTLFGSTADATIRKATTPVLVCHTGRTELQHAHPLS